MPQCPKCNINAFHNSECLRCGYIDKVQKEKRVKNKIEENNLSSKPIDKNNLKPKINYNLITCPDCKKEISRNAEACPHCGAPNKALSSKKSFNIFYIIILVFVFVIFFMFTDTGKMMFNSDYKECRKVLNEALCREVHIYN